MTGKREIFDLSLFPGRHGFGPKANKHRAPKHSMGLPYMPTLTPKTTPTDRHIWQSHGVTECLGIFIFPRAPKTFSEGLRPTWHLPQSHLLNGGIQRRYLEFDPGLCARRNASKEATHRVPTSMHLSTTGVQHI